MYKFKDFSNNH